MGEVGARECLCVDRDVLWLDGLAMDPDDRMFHVEEVVGQGRFEFDAGVQEEGREMTRAECLGCKAPVSPREDSGNMVYFWEYIDVLPFPSNVAVVFPDRLHGNMELMVEGHHNLPEGNSVPHCAKAFRVHFLLHTQVVVD